MDDMLVPFLSVLLVVGIVVALFAKPSLNLFPREAAVRERIRREVNEEFDQSIQQSTGLRRWWLIRKREREISRRVSQVIYRNGAS